LLLDSCFTEAGFVLVLMANNFDPVLAINSRLHVVRVERDLVGDQHDAASTACFTPSSSFWFLRLRLPYRRAENTVMISSTSFAKSSSNVVSSPWLMLGGTGLADLKAGVSNQ
jgi:hypothetical protein